MQEKDRKIEQITLRRRKERYSRAQQKVGGGEGEGAGRGEGAAMAGRGRCLSRAQKSPAQLPSIRRNHET